MSGDRQHWEAAYAKSADALSWHQEEPRISLDLIARASPKAGARVLDVGGGASRLVDHLLGAGFDVSVLDIAAAGMAQARQRLGDSANKVEWIMADVTTWRPDRAYDVWHDRAVLHFLTQIDEQRAYAHTLRQAVAPRGAAIIGGFAPGGRTKCSGLDIVQHDHESLTRLLGADFVLREELDVLHVTPAGVEQPFRFHRFERIS